MNWKALSIDEVEILFAKADTNRKLIYRSELQSAIKPHSLDKLLHVKDLQGRRDSSQAGNQHCLIFVNGLAEFAKLNSKTLSERSHFQLLIDICERNKHHDICTTLVDIRHPARCALFASRERRQDYEIMASLPFDSSANIDEIRQIYMDATKRLIDNMDGIGHIDFKIISTTGDKSIAAFLSYSFAEIQQLFKAVKKRIYSIHAGGILAPYLLEAILGKIDGNHYFYQFSHLNTSFSLCSYNALLGPRPDLKVNHNSQCLLRPGNLLLSGDFELADQKCIDKLSRYSEKSIVLSIGRDVVNQLNPDYTLYLQELKKLTSDLVYAYFSEGDTSKNPPNIACIEVLGIETVNIGYAPNLFQCLKRLIHFNIVVFNPRHFGNGGCLLQAVQAGIPVLVCRGNDSDNFHPSNHIVKAEGDAVKNSYKLFTSKSFRAKWITDGFRKLKIENTKSKISLDKIISLQKHKKRHEKIFVVGNNRTGTASLANFLEAIGYNVAPQRPAVRKYIQCLDQKVDLWADLSLFIGNHDAFRDLPFSDKGILQELVEYFPESRFIYSTRDPRSWYNSLLMHHSILCEFPVFDDDGCWSPRDQQEMIQALKEAKLVEDDRLSIGEIHMAIFGLADENQIFDRCIYMQHQADHEKNALKLLRDKNYLIIDIARDSSVEAKICQFLEIEQPLSACFPHLNKTPIGD